MNKTELIKELARHTDLSQAKAADIVDLLFDAEKGLIANQLKAGDKLVIPGFGSFFARKREEREARNPSTGKTIKVPAKNYPVFKPGKTLKESCEKITIRLTPNCPQPCGRSPASWRGRDPQTTSREL